MSDGITHATHGSPITGVNYDAVHAVLESITVGSSRANQLKIAGSDATFPLTLTAQGSDTNVSVELVPKGLGAVTTPAQFRNGPVSVLEAESVLANLSLVTVGDGAAIGGDVAIVAASNPQIFMVTGGGSITSPAPPDGYMGAIVWYAWDGSQLLGVDGIYAKATSLWDAGNQGMQLEFWLTPDGDSHASTTLSLIVAGDSVTVPVSVNFPNLPTSDPGVPGQLYRVAGTVMVSL